MNERPHGAPPLTHQELLAHAGAFVRAGWRVDLAASDRAARRLALQARVLGGEGGAEPDAALDRPAAPGSGPDPAAGLPSPCTETLWLDDWGGGDLRLTRSLQTPGLAPATVELRGRSVEVLLQRLEDVPRATQFEWTGPLAWSLALRLSADAAEPVVRAAEARLPGLQLKASVSSVRGYDAELRIDRTAPAGTAASAAGPATARLPDDLLEVLGSSFGRLVPTTTGWRGSIALGGGEPGRSRQVRQRLGQALAYLEGALAAPPAAWHARHRAARWRVSLRRSLPLALGLVVVALGLWGAQRSERSEAWLGALANGAPPLLLVLLFMRREMLRLELPRWPRPPAADAWEPRGPSVASPSTGTATGAARPAGAVTASG